LVPSIGDTAKVDANVANLAIDTTGGVASNSILFDTGAAAYTIGNQGAIQLDPAGQITMNATVAANQVVNAAVNVASGSFIISNSSTTNSLTMGGNITGASNSMELQKTGAGEVILTGTNQISPNADTALIGKVSVMVSGKLTISAGKTWAGQNINTGRASTPAGLYIGTNSAQSLSSGNNTLELSGTGRIFASAMHLGAGAWTATNDNGHNTFNVSASGTSSDPSYAANSRLASNESEYIGLATDSNVVNISNGAYYSFQNGGAGTYVGYGAASGSAAGSGIHNGFNISGTGGAARSFYSSPSSRYFVCGEYGSYNFMNLTSGAGMSIARCNLGEAGNGNYIHATGTGSLGATTVTLGRFCVGGNAGTNNATGNGSGNYVLIDGGATFSSTGGTNLPNCIGGTGTSSNNYMQDDGVGSTMTIQNNNAPLTIGGNFAGGTNSDAASASGNFLAVTNGGYAHVNGVYLEGTGSKVIVGATSIPTYVSGVLTPTTTSTAITAQLEVRADSNANYPIQGINLAKSDSRLEINNGRLVAGQNGIVVPGAMASGLGQVALLGPAYFSTTYAGSSITCNITGTGSLTKEGTGTLTLAAGTNNYSGDTNLVGGILVLTSANPNNETSAVTIDTSVAKLNLNFVGDDVVGSLVINGVTMAAGTYGSSSSGAPNIDDSAFAGTGTLTVSGAAPAPTYAKWASSNGIPGAPAAGDADNDGVPNAVEMVLGGNPNGGMDAGLLPQLALVSNPDGVPAGDYMEFTYRRTDMSVSAGVTAACEYGTDLLGPWTTAVDGVDGVAVLVDNDYAPYGAATARVRVYVPRGANVRIFGRLHVTVP